MSNREWENLQTTAKFVRNRLHNKPRIGIILGTALGGLTEEIANPVEIPYAEIPHFLQSTAPAHAGTLIGGEFAGQNVVCMSGRFHYYEGYSFSELALPVRLFKLLGVEIAIITNAAGAINTAYAPGDFMLISDHLNLLAVAPTRGLNLDQLGPRFFDISTVYDLKLRELAFAEANQLHTCLREGVYAFMTGPQFETPAEIRALRVLGADAVGMSTVPEVITAAHCGLPVLGISVITNMAAGILPQDAPLSQVEEVGTEATADLIRLLKGVLNKL
ncbi:MAG TPA: purine-nucleoside phosphorylase [Clostridiaceae bacterium]|nr:purine-nucleoside phosphorylase [Clostridiaceae bacterium]